MKTTKPEDMVEWCIVCKAQLLRMPGRSANSNNWYCPNVANHLVITFAENLRTAENVLKERTDLLAQERNKRIALELDNEQLRQQIEASQNQPVAGYMYLDAGITVQFLNANSVSAIPDGGTPVYTSQVVAKSSSLSHMEAVRMLIDEADKQEDYQSEKWDWLVSNHESFLLSLESKQS